MNGLIIFDKLREHLKTNIKLTVHAEKKKNGTSIVSCSKLVNYLKMTRSHLEKTFVTNFLKELEERKELQYYQL